jgi:protein gp37
MAQGSPIEWTHHTFNPWIGCAKVSPGCAHCYAETLMDTRYGRVRWGAHGTRARTSAATWRQPLSWARQAARTTEPTRVFCAYLADVFEAREEVEAWREELWDLVARTPHLEWLILTKRPENVLAMIPRAWRAGFPDHVRIGTSVENQKSCDLRVPPLLQVPARNFISAEPLLGPLVLRQEWVEELGWVIVGGESGRAARPMDPAWVRSVRDQCIATGIPFFFKQWGEWTPSVGGASANGMGRVGKKAAGRVLDGRVWNQFPG